MIPNVVSVAKAKYTRKERKALIQREYQGNTEDITQGDKPWFLGNRGPTIAKFYHIKYCL